ncbi:MAG: methyltransferase domain-containing protein [Bacteroidetes bacterium]|nr:methyltransferase domain-containing protein [Bacteroidota bacterium]
MTKKFTNYTQYTRAEDIKRLKFIQQSLEHNIKPGGMVLDIGCGNGNISYQLAKSGFMVTGMDISENAIAEAKRSYQLPNLEFLAVRAEDIGTFRDTKFDALICSEVIEHLTEPEKLTLLFSKYLNPGGIVAVTVPNGFGPREVIITKPFQRMIRKQGFAFKMVLGFKRLLGYQGQTIQSSAGDLTHIQFFSQKSLKSLAQKSGFEMAKLKAANFLENVFPFSIIARFSVKIQWFDCWLADRLPVCCSSGFLSVWKLKNSS